MSRLPFFFIITGMVGFVLFSRGIPVFPFWLVQRRFARSDRMVSHPFVYSRMGDHVGDGRCLSTHQRHTAIKNIQWTSRLRPLCVVHDRYFRAFVRFYKWNTSLDRGVRHTHLNFPEWPWALISSSESGRNCIKDCLALIYGWGRSVGSDCLSLDSAIKCYLCSIWRIITRPGCKVLLCFYGMPAYRPAQHPSCLAEVFGRNGSRFSWLRSPWPCTPFICCKFKNTAINAIRLGNKCSRIKQTSMKNSDLIYFTSLDLRALVISLNIAA